MSTSKYVTLGVTRFANGPESQNMEEEKDRAGENPGTPCADPNALPNQPGCICGGTNADVHAHKHTPIAHTRSQAHKCVQHTRACTRTGAGTFCHQGTEAWPAYDGMLDAGDGLYIIISA